MGWGQATTQSISDTQIRAAISRTTIGGKLLPIIAAETTAGFVEADLTNYFYWLDVQRYGIVPNDAGAAAANTAALQSLLDPTVAGPTGRVVFPNTTGADVYYFDDVIPIRDGCRLDLCGSTIRFLATYISDHDYTGFFYFVRDVSIENGIIDIDYAIGTLTAQVNAGSAIRIGNRGGNGIHFPGDDEDFTYRMGNVVLRNLRIISNCDTDEAKAISMSGGLENVVFENIYIDGSLVLNRGIYYEFGWGHYDAVVANRQSSHARNLLFRNIHVKDLKTSTLSANALELRGAYNYTVDGLFADTVDGVFSASTGEAMFYNVWGDDAGGAGRNVTLRNIVGQNLAGIGIELSGGTDVSATYLSGEGLSESEQVDLLHFSLDGFVLDGAGTGLVLDGPCLIRNGAIRGTTNEGIRITDECVDFDIDRIEVLDGGTNGIRANFGGNIFATERKKVGSIKNCFIAGNADNAINIDHTESVHIAYNRLGYNTAHDPVAETTQNVGVSVGTDGDGVVCEGNAVQTSGASVAYSVTGTPADCEVRNPKGVQTITGAWTVDGLAQTSAANIANKAAAINTVNKYARKKVWDSSNSRLLVALGSADVDGWRKVNGDATIFPA